METDYIKRSDAIEETRKPWITRAELRRRICNIPPADVRPVKRGEWLMMIDSIFNGERFVEWSCSECRYVRKRGWRHTGGVEAQDAKFCENCGADMRPEGGSDG